MSPGKLLVKPLDLARLVAHQAEDEASMSGSDSVPDMERLEEGAEGVELLRESENFGSADQDGGTVITKLGKVRLGRERDGIRAPNTFRHPIGPAEERFDKPRPTALKSGRARVGRKGENLVASVLSNASSNPRHPIVATHGEERLLLTDLDYFETEIEKCRQRLAKNIEEEHCNNEFDEDDPVLGDSTDVPASQTRIQKHFSYPNRESPQRVEGEPSATTNEDKLFDLRKDFKKAINICQAMLVYTKEKHLQAIANE